MFGRMALYSRQGRFAEMADYVNAVVGSSGGISNNPNRIVGISQALSGDYAGAVETLEPLFEKITSDSDGLQDEDEWDGLHALIWAHIQLGEVDEARWLLDAFDESFGDAEARGLLHQSPALMVFARNTLLAGNRELALARFQQAVDAGWRDYYSVLHDPRWDSARDDPRFQELMESVKVDLEAQRTRVEQIEAKTDFVVLVDQVMATKY